MFDNDFDNTFDNTLRPKVLSNEGGKRDTTRQRTNTKRARKPLFKAKKRLSTGDVESLCS